MSFLRRREPEPEPVPEAVPEPEPETETPASEPVPAPAKLFSVPQERRYRFRFEAQDGSGHYRSGSIVDVSEEAALEFLNLREEQRVEYRIPEHILEEIVYAYDLSDEQVDTLLNEGWRPLVRYGIKLSAPHRAYVETHRQAIPYKLVSWEVAD